MVKFYFRNENHYTLTWTYEIKHTKIFRVLPVPNETVEKKAQLCQMNKDRRFTIMDD